MGIQAVENMVKKYACQVTPNKKITPHKLRSTYGCLLYTSLSFFFLNQWYNIVRVLKVNEGENSEYVRND